MTNPLWSALPLFLLAAVGDVAPLPGISYLAGSCSLVPTAHSSFELRCEGRLPVVLEPHWLGNGLAFESPELREAMRRHLDKLREYAQRHAAAAAAHVAEERDKYGYYPALGQPRWPASSEDPHDMSCMFVAVAAGGWLYLVDTFAQESFCLAYADGREPKQTADRHFVFRSAEAASHPLAVSAAQFCKDGWTLSLQ